MRFRVSFLITAACLLALSAPAWARRLSTKIEIDHATKIASAQLKPGNYRLVADEPSLIEETLSDLLQTDAQVLLLNGGTGISSRDGTFEIVNRHLEKVLPGFGELFRMLSFHEIGAAAMLSRATAGICAGRILVSLPGSPAAVRLAWEKLLQPELRHLVREASR